MEHIKKKVPTKKQMQKLFFGKYQAWIEDQMFIPLSLKKYMALGKEEPVTLKEWDSFFAWHFMGRALAPVNKGGGAK